MFRAFFLNKKYLVWSVGCSTLIVLATWYKVTLDVKINDWFGSFYDLIQQALTKPNSVTFPQLLAEMLVFFKIAAVFILVAVGLSFYIRHFIFQWRTALNDYYIQHWEKLHHIEGASQRVQEDTMRFARVTESLGESLLDSLMTLFAFLPILWGLSKGIKELPWIGNVPHALVWVALISAIIGTVLLAVTGIKLPGLEFNNQKVEAAYRKELVHGEDDSNRARPPTLRELYEQVRKNYFTLYFHYLYFDLVKWSYLQATVLIPYIALGPAIVSGAITYGVMQQTVRAFGRVEQSFKYLVYSWGTIIELLSIYKRLKAFEKEIK